MIEPRKQASLELVRRDCADLTLAELASIANSEHEAMMGAATAAFVHAVRVGEALNAAFVQIPRGGWQDWVGANCTFSVQNAVVCRRIAFYATDLIAAGITSVKKAEVYLKEEGLKLPWVGGHAPKVATTRERKVAVIQMRQEGASYQDIAEAFAISTGRAWDWCNPDKAKARIQQKTRERADLRRLRRNDAMKVAGGATYEGYSLLRKAAIVFQVAIDREADKDAKRALSNALAKLYEAEDELYRAVRLTQEATKAA